MKLVPMEPKWIDASALELFNGLRAERDRVIREMHTAMGDVPSDDNETATALAMRSQFRITPERRHEIEMSYRPILDALNRKLADVFGRYTVPQAMMVEDDTSP